MANEFKHKSVGSQITQTEYEHTDGTGHIFDSQAAGDIPYASSTTVLSRLGIGTAGKLLQVNSGATAPEWTAAITGATSILNAALVIGRDADNDIDFATDNTILFRAGAADQIKLIDGVLAPVADNDIDLGTSSLEFKDAFFDGTVTSDAFAGPLTGDVTGNADTATALATGRTIGMTGDVVWTSASFTGAGNVTGAATIQSTSVESGMLNNNIISGLTEITSGLADADELLYSDGGVIKRVGLDTLSTKVLTGNAATATTLATTRAINGVNFDGSAAITVTAAGSTLSDTVTVAKGGTNATSLADKAVLITQDSGTDTVAAAAMSTNGQLLIGGSSGPAVATLTAGDNVTITNADGGITIASADAGDATNASHILVTDNESTNENNLITFVENATDSTGNVGLEMDGTLTYNPSTGKVTATGFIGALTGQADTVATIAGLAPNTATTQAAQPNITSLGTLTTLTVDNVITNGATIGHTDDTDLLTLADGILTVAGEVSMTTLDLGGTNVTSDAAELNLLDGVSGLVQADFTKLAAVDSTAAELNLMDGDTSVGGSITVGDSDGFIVNDGGTMKTIPATDVKTYAGGSGSIYTLKNETTISGATQTNISDVFEVDCDYVITIDISQVSQNGVPFPYINFFKDSGTTAQDGEIFFQGRVHNTADTDMVGTAGTQPTTNSWTLTCGVDQNDGIHQQDNGRPGYHGVFYFQTPRNSSGTNQATDYKGLSGTFSYTDMQGLFNTGTLAIGFDNAVSIFGIGIEAASEFPDGTGAKAGSVHGSNDIGSNGWEGMVRIFKIDHS